MHISFSHEKEWGLICSTVGKIILSKIYQAEKAKAPSCSDVEAKKVGFMGK